MNYEIIPTITRKKSQPACFVTLVAVAGSTTLDLTIPTALACASITGKYNNSKIGYLCLKIPLRRIWPVTPGFKNRFHNNHIVCHLELFHNSIRLFRKFCYIF